MTAPTTKSPTTRHLKLDIAGMTCTSCAMRVEKKLNKIEGVSASVNYATEKATVEAADSVTVDDLIETVKKTGYSATEHRKADSHGEGQVPRENHDMHSAAGLLQRLRISAALSLPVLLLSMIPPLQFDNWQWLTLTLASPVVAWGAWPFHQAAWTNAHHGAVTMDTLVSIGVGAAYRTLEVRRVDGFAGEGLDHARPAHEGVRVLRHHHVVGKTKEQRGSG